MFAHAEHLEPFLPSNLDIFWDSATSVATIKAMGMEVYHLLGIGLYLHDS